LGTSSAFGIDNVAPSSVGVPTFGTIATSSIQITKPVAVTENGSGLYQWQARKNETTELGYIATSTNTVTDSDLLPNTQYTYDVKFKDNSNNISSYGTQANKYTLIQIPTGISFDNIGVGSLTVSATGTLSNISTASSGLFFSETSGNTGGANSTWQQVNSYQNTGLSENTQYTFKAMARNGNSTETEYTTTSSKYTLADTPTNLSASSNSNSVTLNVDSFTNPTSGSSGYYFSNTTNGNNSGWIQTNTWTNTELSCGQAYDYSVKYRNGDGVETDLISISETTSSCPRSGGTTAATRVQNLLAMGKNTEAQQVANQYGVVVPSISIASTPTTTIQTTYYLGTTTLKNGSKGEPVKELQRFLNKDLKINLIVDGKLGPKTIAIIKKWQKAHGLTPDGLVGKNTKAKMNAKAN